MGAGTLADIETVIVATFCCIDILIQRKLPFTGSVYTQPVKGNFTLL